MPRILFSKRDEPCPRCGRVFEAFAGKRWCDDCIPVLEAEREAARLRDEAVTLTYTGLLAHGTSDISFETSKTPHEANMGAWEAAQRWEADQNLYFWGPPGTGKSHLARCVLMRALGAGRSVGEITASRFCIAAVSYEGRGVLPRLSAPEVVLLDDLDKGLWSPRTLVALWELLDRRAMGRRRTLITANLAPPAMLEVWRNAAPENVSIAQGISDRLLPMGVWNLTGPSMRGREAG